MVTTFKTDPFDKVTNFKVVETRSVTLLLPSTLAHISNNKFGLLIEYTLTNESSGWIVLAVGGKRFLTYHNTTHVRHKAKKLMQNFWQKIQIQIMKM